MMLRMMLQISVLMAILVGFDSASPIGDIPVFVPSHSLRQFFLEPVELRWSPRTLNERQTRQMIERYDFYERSLNPHSDLPNIYLPIYVQGQVFVTDMRHDLLWATGIDIYASSGSASERLASVCYAGYNDWRLPTLEELASLLEAPAEGRTRHYNSAFSDASLDTALTSDMTEDGRSAWSVRFDEGIVEPVEAQGVWKILAVRSASKLPIHSKCKTRL